VLRRLILLACPLALTACPSFAVGPDAYALVERDGSVCAEAELGDDPCAVFDLDNGTIYDDDAVQPLLLQLGFSSSERNLDFVNLSYERPGLPPIEQTCGFGIHLIPQGSGQLACFSATLAGTTEEEVASVSETAQGILQIDLDILANEVGPYAISAWLTDDNGYESPVVRWQFNVFEPERE